MKADYRLLLDACVLANFGVCDLLLRLAERPEIVPPCLVGGDFERGSANSGEKAGLATTPDPLLSAAASSGVS